MVERYNTRRGPDATPPSAANDGEATLAMLTEKDLQDLRDSNAYTSGEKSVSAMRGFLADLKSFVNNPDSSALEDLLVAQDALIRHVCETYMSIPAHFIRSSVHGATGTRMGAYVDKRRDLVRNIIDTIDNIHECRSQEVETGEDYESEATYLSDMILIISEYDESTGSEV